MCHLSERYKISPTWSEIMRLPRWSFGFEMKVRRLSRYRRVHPVAAVTKVMKSSRRLELAMGRKRSVNVTV